MPTITAGELIDATYSRLENNTRMYPRAQILRQINNAVKILNLHCGLLKVNRDVGPTVTDRFLYNPPEDMIYVIKCFLEGRYLDTTQLTDLLSTNPTAFHDTTESRFAPVSSYIPVGTTLGWINPAPSTPGMSLQFAGVIEPTKLVSDSDVCQLPNEMAPVIADYAAHMTQFKLGGVPFNQSLAYLNNFREFLTQRSIWNMLDFPTWKVDNMQQKLPT